MTRIVGLLRFSIVSEQHKQGYRSTRDLSVQEALRVTLAPDRLEQRLHLVEAMPLASLSAQTDDDFELAMFVSTELPAVFRKRVERLAAERPYVRLVDVAPHDVVRDVMSALLTPGERTVTFRLDDDDAVHPEHVADLRAMATADSVGRVLSHPHGVYLEPDDRGELLRQDVEYPNNAYGLAFCSTDTTTVFHLGPHHDQAEDAMIVHPRPAAWLRSIHADSDSGVRIDRSTAYGPLDPAALLDYSFVDWNTVRGELAAFAPSRRSRVGRLLRRS